jgi:hypothetical protein
LGCEGEVHSKHRATRAHNAADKTAKRSGDFTFRRRAHERSYKARECKYRN